MKQFIEYLMQVINESGKFGNVMLFNEQPDKTRKHQYKATKKRSVYIEPVVNEVMTRSLGINQYDMTIRVYIANDNKKFSKLEDITLLEDLNSILQNLNKVEDNVFTFSSMVREFFELDSDHDQISEPFNEYRTTLTDFTGYKYRNLTEGSFASTDISVTIEDSL